MLLSTKEVRKLVKQSNPNIEVSTRKNRNKETCVVFRYDDGASANSLQQVLKNKIKNEVYRTSTPRDYQERIWGGEYVWVVAQVA
jgi:hypothetical protein